MAVAPPSGDARSIAEPMGETPGFHGVRPISRYWATGALAAVAALLPGAAQGVPARATPPVSAGTVTASRALAGGTKPRSALAFTAGRGTTPQQVEVQQLGFAGPKDGWIALARWSPTGTGATATEVLGTTDGGAHWRLEWRGTGDPVELSALSSDDADLLVQPVTSCSVSQASCATKMLATQLVSTTDGGQVWHQAWTSSAQLSSLAWASPAVGVGALQASSCPTASLPSLKGASCPDQVVRTLDGGRHWSGVLKPSGLVLAVAHDGARQWWALQAPADRGDQPLPESALTVWQSTDGASSWSREGTIGVQQLGLFGPGEATLVVAAHGDLWLSMVNPGSCAMHGCAVAKWRSPDGGRTWLPVPAPARFAGQCGQNRDTALVAAPDGLVYMAGGVNLATCEPPAALLARWDANSWQVVHYWPLATVTALDWPSESSLYALAGGALAVSRDGGHHWSQLWPAPAPLGPLDALSATTAVAAGDLTDPGVVLGTSDSGTSWSVLADLPGEVTTLAFPSASTGFLALLDPARNTWALWASSDGGRAWARRWAVPEAGLAGWQWRGITGLWSASPKQLLVLTTAGASVYGLDGGPPATLWASSDGGHTWGPPTIVPFPATEISVASAAFTLDRAGDWRGLVVLSGTSALTEQLQHRAWTRRPGFPGLAQLDLLGAMSVYGWQTTGNGQSTLLRSGDGGTHWSRYPLPPAIYDYAVGAQLQLDFVNLRDGWWSEDGDAWTTSDGGASWVLRSSPEGGRLAVAVS
jgi:hypothetical protein